MEGGNKRVRFSVEEPDPDDDESDKPRKLRFPKGKKGGAGAENTSRSHQKDARVAANERALRRKVMDKHLRSSEDTSNLNDVSQAEEDFEDPDDNVKMEPFNLNAERRDGFFDDDGHYVEYKTKFEARDAWLDNVEVDTRLAEKLLTQSSKEEPEAELSIGDVGRMKERIAEVLEPGETVLEALRRLRGSSKGKREKLTGPAKITFDQLTEDAMKLMDSGETDVYDKVQEKFRRESDAALKDERETLDIFADEPSSPPPTIDAAADAAAEAGGDSSDYVYDSSSGYYYNASTGYFYDPNSGLYCSGESGKWFKFDEATNAYVEAS